MRLTDYAKATYGLIEGGVTSAVALEKLKLYLEAQKKAHLYPKVLKTLKTLYMRNERRDRAVVTLARKEDKTTEAQAITLLAEKEDHHIKPQIVIDPHIIGGFILEQRNHRIDQSYKNALLSTYRRIINH